MLTNYTIRREEKLRDEVLAAAARKDWSACLHQAIELGELTNHFKPLQLWTGGPLAKERLHPPYSLSSYLHALADETTLILKTTQHQGTAMLYLLTLLSQITHPAVIEVCERLAEKLKERLNNNETAGVALDTLISMEEIILSARIQTASCHMLSARALGYDYDSDEFNNEEINPFPELEEVESQPSVAQ